MSRVKDNGIPIGLAKRYAGERLCTYSLKGTYCPKRHFARGLCQAHYMRMRRHGDCGSVDVAPTRPRHLKDHQVVMARRRVKAGIWKPREAAEHFGCSYTTMMDALRGKTFRGVKGAGL